MNRLEGRVGRLEALMNPQRDGLKVFELFDVDGTCRDPETGTIYPDQQAAVEAFHGAELLVFATRFSGSGECVAA